MSNVIQFPVIAGIEIHTDDGRFNLKIWGAGLAF